MLRKLVSIFAVSMVGTSLAYATEVSVYVAPSIAYQSVYVSGAETYEGITGKLGLGGGVRAWTFWYLGGEGFISSKPLNVKTGDPDLYKPQTEYGISILPGYYFDDMILGYLRAGLNFGNFNNLHSTPKGYQIGVGIDWRLGCNLSARGEYNYTRFDAISGAGTLNQNELFLGVVYRLFF